MARVIHAHERRQKPQNVPTSVIQEILSIRDEMAQVLTNMSKPNFVLTEDPITSWYERLDKLALDKYRKPKMLSNKEVKTTKRKGKKSNA